MTDTNCHICGKPFSPAFTRYELLISGQVDCVGWDLAWAEAKKYRAVGLTVEIKDTHGD